MRPPLSECPLLFLDLETTGLDPAEHEVCEIAFARTDHSARRVADHYAAKVVVEHPERVSPEAAAVNGFNELTWAAEAIPLGDALTKLVYMARECILVCHNAAFDGPFLDRAMAAHRLSWPGPRWKLCTMQLAAPLLIAGLVPNLKLATLVEHFGMEQGRAHSALSDMRDCRRLWLALAGGWDAAMPHWRSAFQRSTIVCTRAS